MTQAIYLRSVAAGKAKQTLTQPLHHATKRDEIIPSRYTSSQCAGSLWHRCKKNATLALKNVLTSLLQCHQHGLLNEVSLDEAAEVLRVDGEVGQLEGADGHLQQMFAAAVAGDVGAGQGDDGGAGMGNASRQAFF